MLKGSCACGRIQYETSAGVKAINACHCETCRRVSGGPFLGFVDFQTADLKWTARQPDMWQRSAVAERGFCMVCGSAVSMRYLFQPERMGVTLGTVVEADPPLPRLNAHIFLKEKAAWFVLPDDGAERWDEFPPGFSDKFEKALQEQQSKM